MHKTIFSLLASMGLALAMGGCGATPPAVPDAKAATTAASPDTDNDGIPDTSDKCPTEKEDGQAPDPKDGCPKKA